MAEIEFSIDPAGELTMQVKGIAGPACDDVAKRVKELLGEPAHEWRTPEYYLQPHIQSQIRPRPGR
jgi:hypothetical protein